MTRRTKHPHLSLFPCLCLLLIRPSTGVDTLSAGQSLSSAQTLISSEGTFELGFFANRRNKSYLGIWHKDFPGKTVVWVANRQSPLPDQSSSPSPALLAVSPDGGLRLSHDSRTFWSTDLLAGPSTQAVLLDNGNLILRDGPSSSSAVLWQSFDHPTDTWLPGMPLDRTKSLVSWRTAEDPSPGLFSVQFSSGVGTGLSPRLLLMWNSSDEYWTSGPWNGGIFQFAPEMSYILGFAIDENATQVDYSVLNEKTWSMLVVSPEGRLEQHTSLKSYRKWTTIVTKPEKRNDVFGLCGKFGVAGDDSNCSCLPGFTREGDEGSSWASSGCSVRVPLQCVNDSSSNYSTGKNGKGEGFLKIWAMKLPKGLMARQDKKGRSCEAACSRSCSCSAYSFGDDGCYVWEGDLIDLRNFSYSTTAAHHLWLRLSASQLPNENRKILEVIIAVVVPSVVLLSGGFLGYFYTRKGKQKENKESGEDLLSFDFNYDRYSIETRDDGANSRKRNNNDFDLPAFSYSSICTSTNNFSPGNKLGEGGFGPVYKGKLLNGQEIAVKRLSKKSGQGLEEFRNEIMLIAKVQHRNLVRLLGCCIDPNEGMLIYEYMPNKSLDFFIFDSNKQELLDWETRVRIVEGIAAMTRGSVQTQSWGHMVTWLLSMHWKGYSQ